MGEEYLEATEDFIFPNTFYTMRKFLEHFQASGTKPEFEVYDVGMINNLAHLIANGLVQKPVYLQFVMGSLGGIPATIDNLVYLLNTARAQIGIFSGRSARPDASSSHDHPRPAHGR